MARKAEEADGAPGKKRCLVRNTPPSPQGTSSCLNWKGRKGKFAGRGKKSEPSEDVQSPRGRENAAMLAGVPIRRTMAVQRGRGEEPRRETAVLSLPEIATSCLGSRFSLTRETPNNEGGGGREEGNVEEGKAWRKRCGRGKGDRRRGILLGGRGRRPTRRVGGEEEESSISFGLLKAGVSRPSWRKETARRMGEGKSSPAIGRDLSIHIGRGRGLVWSVCDSGENNSAILRAKVLALIPRQRKKGNAR